MTRVFLLVLLFSSATTPSRAEDAVEARYFEARARDAERRGDLRRALEGYLHASRIVASPRLVFETARVAARAGEEALAWSLYERYLAAEHATESEARRDEAARERARLEAGGRFGVLEVTSEPLGARVYVDRAEYGLVGVTPCRVAIEPGSRTLLLEHEGFHATSQTVEVAPGMRSRLVVALRPRTGRLVIVAPTDSRFGVRRVEEPPSRVEANDQGDMRAVEVRANSSVELPVGTYEIRSAERSDPSLVRRVQIRAGQTSRVVSQSPRRMGRLLVQCEPPATLFVDGVERARTPAARVELVVGEHQVELVAPGHRRWRRTLRIGEANTYLDVRLLPE